MCLWMSSLSSALVFLGFIIQILKCLLIKYFAHFIISVEPASGWSSNYSKLGHNGRLVHRTDFILVVFNSHPSLTEIIWAETPGNRLEYRLVPQTSISSNLFALFCLSYWVKWYVNVASRCHRISPSGILFFNTLSFSLRPGDAIWALLGAPPLVTFSMTIPSVFTRVMLFKVSKFLFRKVGPYFL